MKIITSPAKLMNVENSTEFLKSTTPKFIEEATLIHSYLKEKSPQYLSELMEISAKLADENWHRNQVWKPKPTAKESAPALFAFTGEVYRGLDAKTLSKDAVDYLQKNQHRKPDLNLISHHLKQVFVQILLEKVLIFFERAELFLSEYN